jgi:hypothetical protein
MGMFYLWGSFVFSFLFVLGLPFALCLMMRGAASQASGWLLLAPAFGAALYFSAGTTLHSFGLRAFAVFWTLLGLSAVASIFILRSRRPPLRVFLVALGACSIGAALALALNSSDLAVSGLDYFPLTNDDTFAYLGLIDQIRTAGWIEPRIFYPAGYAPLIDHAVFTRAPSGIFSADLADVLALESHSAFFLSQRMALPVIALGASAIVMMATGSWVATLLCFAPLVFGNALLHQILQQFSSSTLGTVVAPVIVMLAIWTVRSERSEREIVAGHGLTGWGCGTLAITSMEAHPFYLMAFGLVALLPIVRHRQLKRTVSCLGAFIFGYLLASCILVLKIWPALVSQFVNAGNGHPGDWIASPGFLMQATGVAFTTTSRLMYYAGIPLVTAIIVFVVYLSAIAMIGWSLVKVAESEPVLRTDRTALFLIVVMVTALQVFLYGRGVGYGLLKLTDYFAFLGSVVIAVAVFQLGLTKAPIVRCSVLAAVAVYCLVAFVQKQRHILGFYAARIAQMPMPSAFRLDGKVKSETVLADLSGEPLNLFLYENRYLTTPIVFRPSESYRFTPLHGAMPATPRYIARIPWIGPSGARLADITYPAETMPAELMIVPAVGQIHLLLPDGNWGETEGGAAGGFSRWLTVSGKFIIFGSLTDQARLTLEMSAGPDLRPDNRIEVYFAGHLLQSVAPGELPVSVDVPLAAQTDPESVGEIRITGLAVGTRQVSVAQLRSFPR